MADNYLEKQRSDYEARKAAWEKAKKHGSVNPTVKKVQKDADQKEDK